MSKSEIVALLVGTAISIMVSYFFYKLSKHGADKSKKTADVTLRLAEINSKDKGCRAQKDAKGDPTGALDFHVTCNEETKVSDSGKIRAHGSADARVVRGNDGK